MPIPSALLKAAFTALPEKSLRKAGEHCCPRRRGTWDTLTVDELIDKLSADGTNLCSISFEVLTIVDIKKVCKVFGIETKNSKDSKLRSDVWDFVFGYDKRQERKVVHQQRGVPPLEAEVLLAEVRSMAKPCIHLTRNPKDGPFAAVWGGPGIVPAPQGNPDERPSFMDEEDECDKYRHWITLNCSTLPDEFKPLMLRGSVSIYSDEWSGYTTKRKKDQDGYLARDPKTIFQQNLNRTIQVGNKVAYSKGNEGVPLFAKLGLSFPSRFQVIQYPTPTIRNWLTKMGHSFKTNDNYSFATEELRDVYEEFRVDPNPIFKEDCGIIAVIGGWTIDMEYTYQKLLGDRFYQLVYTLEDSEPWIQAFICKKTGEYYIRQLIT